MENKGINKKKKCFKIKKLIYCVILSFLYFISLYFMFTHHSTAGLLCMNLTALFSVHLIKVSKKDKKRLE